MSFLRKITLFVFVTLFVVHNVGMLLLFGGVLFRTLQVSSATAVVMENLDYLAEALSTWAYGSIAFAVPVILLRLSTAQDA